MLKKRKELEIPTVKPPPNINPSRPFLSFIKINKQNGKQRRRRFCCCCCCCCLCTRAQQQTLVTTSIKKLFARLCCVFFPFSRAQSDDTVRLSAELIIIVSVKVETMATKCIIIIIIIVSCIASGPFALFRFLLVVWW